MRLNNALIEGTLTANHGELETVEGEVEELVAQSAIVRLRRTHQLSYVLESSTNLNPPVLWLPLLTNTANGAGVYQFIDPNPTDAPMRFYRVKSP